MSSIRWGSSAEEAELRWLSSEQEARFKLWFLGREVWARVSREVLEEQFGPRNSDEEYLDVVIENILAVETRIQWLLQKNRFETDGTLLLKQGDW